MVNTCGSLVADFAFLLAVFVVEMLKLFSVCGAVA